MPTWKEVVKSVSKTVPKGTSLKDILPLASKEWQRIKKTGESIKKTIGKTRIGRNGRTGKRRGKKSCKKQLKRVKITNRRRPFFRGGSADDADGADMSEKVERAQETTGGGVPNSLSNTQTPHGMPPVDLIEGGSGPEAANEQKLAESFAMYGGRRRKRTGCKSSKRGKKSAGRRRKH